MEAQASGLVDRAKMDYSQEKESLKPPASVIADLIKVEVVKSLLCLAAKSCTIYTDLLHQHLAL